MKVLGTGWGSKVGWLDIEILRAPGGKPEVYLRNKACIYAQGLGVRRFSISITHTELYAVATVIAEDA